MSKFVAIGILSAFSFSLATPIQAQQTLFDANWGVINKIENRRMMREEQSNTTSGSSSGSSSFTRKRHFSDECKEAINSRYSREELFAAWTSNPLTFSTRMREIAKSIPECS